MKVTCGSENDWGIHTVFKVPFKFLGDINAYVFNPDRTLITNKRANLPNSIMENQWVDWSYIQGQEWFKSTYFTHTHKKKMSSHCGCLSYMSRNNLEKKGFISFTVQYNISLSKAVRQCHSIFIAMKKHHDYSNYHK